MLNTNATIVCTRFPGLRFRAMAPAECHRLAEPGRVWALELDSPCEPARLELRENEIVDGIDLEVLDAVSRGEWLRWTPEIGGAWDRLLARGLVDDSGELTEAGRTLLGWELPPRRNL